MAVTAVATRHVCTPDTGGHAAALPTRAVAGGRAALLCGGGRAARCAAAISSADKLSGWEPKPSRRVASVRDIARTVEIAIEPGPANSRCIWAGVDVSAPAPALYAALTSYEALGTFIPGLAENRCLERYPDGCRLLQVGRQDVALGLRFCARVCLRITEHPAGMPPRMQGLSPNACPQDSSCAGGARDGNKLWWPFGGPLSSSSGGDSSSSEEAPSGSGRQAFSEARFLAPRSPLGTPPMDVSFDLLSGDFSAFKGLWRAQSAGPSTSRLSYTLFVRPQPWLLVGLVEQRIRDEIAGNLAAVKGHVEAQMQAGTWPPPPTRATERGT